MAISIGTESYLTQSGLWPQFGRHILAHYDDEGIIVYQAYSPRIGNFAAEHGYFGGDGFSFERMSWIKPNFLWMMYRSGWGTKAGQEVVLALRLRRTAFDALLAQAVPSTHNPTQYPNEHEWRQAVSSSDVRVQWDPDHDPAGKPLERRALQLGLRAGALRHFALEWLLGIEDVSQYIREQRQHALSGDYADLMAPRERIYPVADSVVAQRLGIGLSR